MARAIRTDRQSARHRSNTETTECCKPTMKVLAAMLDRETLLIDANPAAIAYPSATPRRVNRGTRLDVKPLAKSMLDAFLIIVVTGSDDPGPVHSQAKLGYARAETRLSASGTRA